MAAPHLPRVRHNLLLGSEATAPTESPQAIRTFTTVEAPPAEVYRCKVYGLTFATRAELEAHIAEAHPPVAPVPPTPIYIWVMIGIGAILVIVVIPFLMRTRRPV